MEVMIEGILAELILVNAIAAWVIIAECVLISKSHLVIRVEVIVSNQLGS